MCLLLYIKQTPFSGQITDFPDKFKGFIVENENRLKNAKSVPLFVQDNKKAVEKILNPKLSIAERAKIRHEQRTLAQKDDIQQRWDNRKNKGGMFGSDNIVYSEKFIDVPITADMSATRENTLMLAKQLGYSDKAAKTITPMSYADADRGKANYYNDDENCQSCVISLLARLRGLNVTALPYEDGGFAERLSNDMTLAFKSADGKKIVPKSFRGNNIKKQRERLERYIEENLKDNSIYHLGFDKDMQLKDGHIITIIKSDNKVYAIDGQQRDGKIVNLERFLDRINFKQDVNLLRVDNLDFNESILEIMEHSR